MMMFSRRWLLQTSVATATCAAAALLPKAGLAFPTSNLPVAAAGALDAGPADPSHPMKLTVVLKLHEEAGLSAAIDALYDPASPTFRQWLTPAALARYMPTAAELATVRAALEQAGYRILSVGPQGLSLRVQGTVGITEKAFHTALHTFRYHGRSFIAHVQNAQLAGPANDLVASIVGLDQHDVRPMLAVAKDPETGQPLFQKPATPALLGSIGAQISDVVLGPPQMETFSTNGGNPTGTYTGAVYAPKGLIVSFTPVQLQSYYGLPALYQLGFTGKGQTIALIDAYGYTAALKDANTAAAAFGLPPLTSATFHTAYPYGKPHPSNLADLTGWTVEIALDVQTAHSIAPGAKIVVVASDGQDNEAQIASMEWIIARNVSKNISGSFENDLDLESSSQEREAFNTVLKYGAAQGFSFQFSSGDGGDNGVGKPAGAPGLPSESPYATAVGGTSIVNDPGSPGRFFPTGWGTDISVLALGGTALMPGSETLFDGGGGGGRSLHFKKPSWQKALPGSYRLCPDVSALGDDFTGFVIVYTDAGQQSVLAGIGGTSLASPLFTGIWSIAGQYAGLPLGQAAPTIARLSPGEITDVRPGNPAAKDDVTGSYTDSAGKTTKYSAYSLFFASPGQQSVFTSGLYTPFAGEGLAISFGTDTSLRVASGWDDVTGFGEPHGLRFVTAVAKGH